jgi:hypothetical protein
VNACEAEEKIKSHLFSYIYATLNNATVCDQIQSQRSPGSSLDV